MCFHFIHGRDAGGAVLVRSLEWSSEQSAAERTTSHAADERLRRALLHPAACLRTASCESPSVWTPSVCAQLVLSFKKLYV